MGKVIVELDRAGVRELLLSPDLQEGMEHLAYDALGRLGDGYSVNTYHGRNRVNVEVTADTYEAAKENMEYNTILKAVQG